MNFQSIIDEIKIPRGVYVRDIVSGFEGIAAGYSKPVGELQVLVSPQHTSSDKTLNAGEYIDQSRLQLTRTGNVVDGFTDIYSPPIAPELIKDIADSKIGLLDEVECKVTGFRGVVTQVVIFFSGCVYFTVTPNKARKGKYPESVFFNGQHLRLIKSAKADKEKPTEERKERPGGPSLSAKNFRQC